MSELHLELFAGPGGMSEALRLHGLRADVAVEVDLSACMTARAAGHARQLGDVYGLNPARAVDGARVAGMLAAPPCQGFSSAGLKAGRADLDAILELIARTGDADEDHRADYLMTMRDHRSLLVVEPLRWAVALEPEWVVLEQVPSVLPIWQATAKVLEARGYRTWVGITSAEEFGVAQVRHRAILLASRTRRVSAPSPARRRWDDLGSGLPAPVPMVEALAWGMTARPFPTIASARTTGGPDKEKVGGSGARRALYAERAAGRWVGHPDPAKDGPDGIRVSIPETAILQSFRPDYPWHGTATQVGIQVGNAHPPLLGAALIEAVR